MKKFSMAIFMALGAMTLSAQTISDLKMYVQGGSYLGIGVKEVDSSRVQALKLKEERGVEVTNVEDDSPAAMAGVKVGDVVLEYQGEVIQGVDQFVRLVRETPAGRKVKLGVWRNGGNTNLMATVGNRKSMAKAIQIPRIEVPQVYIPDIPRPVTTWRTAPLGVDVEAIDGQFAQYFGVAKGVLVRSLHENSAAKTAGMKAGDVVIKIGSTEVDTPRELSRQLGDYAGKNAALTVVRDHKEMTVSVAIPGEVGRGNNMRSRVEFIAD